MKSVAIDGVTVPYIYPFWRPTPRLAKLTDFPGCPQSNNSANKFNLHDQTYGHDDKCCTAQFLGQLHQV